MATAAVNHRPNFIFFQPDEMRADALGCYGNADSSTPNFDAFVSGGGVRFDQAHVSYTVCSQSRVAFMTGWHTHVRGHRTLWSLLHSDEPNMLRYLKEEGNYTVMWWGKNDLLADDAWETSVTSAKTMGGTNHGTNPYNESDPRYYSFLYDPPAVAMNDTQDFRNVQAAIDFLNSENATEKPFALFLPLTLPHPPYSCPEPYYSSVDPDSLPPLRPANLTGRPDYHHLIRRYRGLDQLSSDDSDALLRKIRAVYLGCVSYSDALFGQLMSALDTSTDSIRDNTHTFVWADHGDYAGDYGLVEKWPSGLEDVLTRVPLLVRLANGSSSGSGQTVDAPVQVFDIVPTVLDLANISATHVHFAQSLLPQLLGEPGDVGRRVFAEGGYSTHEPRDFEGRCDDPTTGCSSEGEIYWPKERQEQEEPLSVCRAVMIRTNSHKLVLRSDPLDDDHCSELYDLTNDPQELNNVYNDTAFQDVAQQLKGELLSWFLQTSDVTPWEEDTRGGQPGWIGETGPRLGQHQRGGPGRVPAREYFEEEV